MPLGARGSGFELGRARGRSPRRGLFQVLERDEEATRAGGRHLVGREFERVDSRFFGGEQAVVDLHYQFGGGAAVGEVREGVGQVAGLQRVGLHANGYRGGTLGRAAKQRDGVLVERAGSDKVEAARAVQEAVFVGLGGRGVGPRRIVAARHGGGSGEKAGGEEGENMEFHCVSE